LEYLANASDGDIGGRGIIGETSSVFSFLVLENLGLLFLDLFGENDSLLGVDTLVSFCLDFASGLPGFITI